MGKSNRGFTLIELVLVLVLLGVVGVMTIPEYLDASAQALLQAKWEKSGEVKSLHREISKARHAYPSVTALAAHLPGKRVQAREHGIILQVDDAEYLIPTYRNARCTELTRTAQDPVACVGTIPG